MKRDLKINFSILDDIVSETTKYKSALEEMKEATSKMISLFEENEGEIATELKELYAGFTAEIEKCYTEVNDINTIFVNYIGEMEYIIAPFDREKIMRVDRNDIWANKEAIIASCRDIQDMPETLRPAGFMCGPSFGKSESQIKLEELIYGKVEEINFRLMPTYGRKFNELIDELNAIYNNKIVPFENKDDEFANKADELYDKYTDFWERLGDWISTGWDFVKNFVIGGFTAISDLVCGIFALAGGIIKLVGAACIMDVTEPLGITPNWAKETAEGTDAVVSAILNDPLIIVESLAQEFSDNFEEKGAAYCVGYVIIDLLVPDAIDKGAKAFKLRKVAKYATKLDDVGDAGTLIIKSIDDIDNLSDLAKNGKKVFNKIDISHLDDAGLMDLLTKADDAKLKELSKFVDSDQLTRLLNSTDDIKKIKAIAGDLSDPNVRKALQQLDDIKFSKFVDELSDADIENLGKIDDELGRRVRKVSEGVTQANDVSVGSMNFMDKNDNFYKNALNRKDIDPNGYYDIIAHGTPNGIQMTINGKKQIVDHRMLANILKNSNDYNGQNIRLLSCSTGALDNGFAKNLANKLNVEVLAPTDYLWAYPNGKMVVAPMTINRLPDLKNQGVFKLFTPGKLGG